MKRKVTLLFQFLTWLTNDNSVWTIVRFGIAFLQFSLGEKRKKGWHNILYYCILLNGIIWLKWVFFLFEKWEGKNSVSVWILKRLIMGYDYSIGVVNFLEDK